MFAVNYFTGIVGGGVAYVDHKLTVQLEATLLQLMRVRGENAASATDSARTNSTVGLHAGYFFIPMLSLGGEIRYQRWLSTPTTLTMGNKVNFTDANMDTLTVAIGPRVHFQISKGMFIRPGIAYARALDKPLSDASYNVVQVDVPLYFLTMGPWEGPMPPAMGSDGQSPSPPDAITMGLCERPMPPATGSDGRHVRLRPTRSTGRSGC